MTAPHAAGHRPGVYTKLPRPTLWLVRGDEEVPSFYLSKTVITNEHYRAFDPNYLPAEISPGPNHPAVNIDLHHARAYCAWYSRESGKTFRLPTDPEWDLACRAGTLTRYFWGDDPDGGEPFVWDARNSGGRAPEVETKKANPGGLHDLLGGVREWTESGALRGGSFRSDRAALRWELKEQVDPSLRADDIGFRIVRSL